jgi:hypothetical protein
LLVAIRTKVFDQAVGLVILLFNNLEISDVLSG